MKIVHYGSNDNAIMRPAQIMLIKDFEDVRDLKQVRSSFHTQQKYACTIHAVSSTGAVRVQVRRRVLRIVFL